MKFIRPSGLLPTESTYTTSNNTAGTYYDSIGTMYQSVVGIPRRTYDPACKAYDGATTCPYVGLLYEAAATNLFLNTNAFITQNVTASAVDYTVSFRRDSTNALVNGTITITGAVAATVELTNATASEWEWTSWTTTTILPNVMYKVITLGNDSAVWSHATAVIGGSILVGSYITFTESYTLNLGGTVQVRKNSRVYKRFTSTGGTLTCTLTGSLIEAQIEVTPTTIGFPEFTSYIPTAVSPVTRTADTVSASTTSNTPGLLYSTVAEEITIPLWVSGNINAHIGDQVYMSGTTHKVYECIVDIANGTIPPDIDEVAVYPAVQHWMEVRPTNRWAMFDNQIGTATSVTAATYDGIASMTYILRPGRIDSLALIELSASKVLVSIVSEASRTTIYSGEYHTLTNNNIGSWYEYFYEPSYQQDILTETNLFETALLYLPLYSDSLLEITIEKAATNDSAAFAQVSCGVMVAGLSTNIGSTQNAPNLGIVDYSRKVTDEFGYTSVTQRRYSKRMSTKVMLKSSSVDSVSRILSLYRATPLVWLGVENYYSSLIIYGFYKDWDITIDNVLYSSCNLQIEGLT